MGCINVTHIDYPESDGTPMGETDANPETGKGAIFLLGASVADHVGTHVPSRASTGFPFP